MLHAPQHRLNDVILSPLGNSLDGQWTSLTTPRKLQLEREMADLYRRAKEAHTLRIAASASSLETSRTKGSSPVSNGESGTSTLPAGPSTQNLRPSITTGSPDSSKKNDADGPNSKGSSGESFTTEDTTAGGNNRAQSGRPLPNFYRRIIEVQLTWISTLADRRSPLNPASAVSAGLPRRRQRWHEWLRHACSRS